MGSNPRSLLSPGQIAQKVYDEVNDRIRVDAQYTSTLAGEIEIAIDSTEDSVTIGDVSGNKVTTTTIGSDVGLDVNVISPTGDKYKLVPVEFDEIDVTAKNSNGDPTTVVYKSAASTVATLTISYDSDGDFQSVVRS